MQKQNIDLDSLEYQSRRMHLAIETFRPYTTDFLNQVITEIEKNRSDFMVELEKILYAFVDSKSKNALSNANAYYEAIAGIHDAWLEIDQKISEDVKVGDGN